MLVFVSISLCATIGATREVAAGDEVNAASYAAGCRQVRESGEVVSTGARNDPGFLLDGDGATNWETSAAQAKLGLILRLSEHFDLTAVEAVAATDRSESLRELLVERGDSPAGPWQQVLRMSLKQGRAPQRFPVNAPGTRLLRLTLVANYGHPGWFGLADFRAYGKRTSARNSDFSGHFTTRFGTMRLSQNGQRVTGCVGGKDPSLSIDCAVAGSSASGTWTEVIGANTRSGSLALVLTEDGDIAGLWSASHDMRSLGNNRWDGKRVAKTELACPAAGRAMSSDLAKNGRVVLRGILFDTGNDEIRPESLPLLEELAMALKAAGGKKYLIEGHTDDRADQAFNLQLSQRRAVAVKAWLVRAGVDGSLLEAVGFGLTKPAMPNDTDAGRAANRRVEISAKIH